VLLGGDVIKRKGNWFAADRARRRRSHDGVMRDESFGPIIGIQAVADDERPWR
jgi:acyl-CoA reductase-like NAD-dependent aldehyde dehydrogenase